MLFSGGTGRCEWGTQALFCTQGREVGNYSSAALAKQVSKPTQKTGILRNYSFPGS